VAVASAGSYADLRFAPDT